MKRVAGKKRQRRQVVSVNRRRRQDWTFLSNHAHVVIALAKDNTLRLRDLADQVGITERAVAQIIGDLQEAKVLEIERQGRRNVYIINPDVPLRHGVESHRTLADLLRLANTRAERR